MTIEPTQDDLSRFISQNLHYCVSTLIYTLAQEYPGDAKGDLAALTEQAFELSTPIPDYEEAAIQEGWVECTEGAGFWYDGNAYESWKAAQSDPDAIVYEDAEDVCQGEDIEPYDREIFEHWCVSEWFARRLAERGERVDMDFAGLTVWGRTTTGQAILLDGIVADIWREIHNAES